MAMRNGRGKQKQRNTGNRERHRVILFAAEGKNKTETLYFRRFTTKDIQVRFTSGNETDPEKLMSRLLEEIQENDLNPELGDCAYCLVDADCNPTKDNQIARADEMAKGTMAELIVSNPSFEIWYLCHFTYSTKEYHSSDEVEIDLKRQMPDYSKNRLDMYERTVSHIDTAVRNAERLEQYNVDAGKKIHTSGFQPSTEVYKVVKNIR